jgi:hypothetical protein
MHDEEAYEGRIGRIRGEGEWPRPRDLEVLRWASEQYGARLDHVAALIERSQEAARLTVIRLRASGFVNKRRFVVGELPWVLPTWKGLTLSHLSGALWDPSVSRLAHVAAINATRLHVQKEMPEVEWISARRLRSEGEESRGYEKHLPDGVAIREGRRAAVKVELHFRGEPTMSALFDELGRRHEATLCFCTPEALRELRPLAESGRWATLGLRELPGVGAPARTASREGR